MPARKRRFTVIKVLALLAFLGVVVVSLAPQFSKLPKHGGRPQAPAKQTNTEDANP